MRMLWLVGLVVGLAASTANAAFYYIGTFDGTTAQDDTNCGLGVDNCDPNVGGCNHPCATIAYWRTTRRTVLADGDTVRINAGQIHTGNTDQHCITPDKSGITYTGRNAANTADALATIDLGAVPAGFTNCSGGGIYCVGCGPTTLTNVEVRYLDFWRSPGLGGGGNYFAPGTGQTYDDIRFRHVVFRNSNIQGLRIGQATNHSANDPCNSVWNTTRVTITDATFTDNGQTNIPNAAAALMFGCVDNAAGGTLARIVIDGVRGAGATQAYCNANPADATYCDNRDGIQPGGIRNATISDLVVANVGEDGVDCCGVGSGMYCDVQGNINLTLDRVVLGDAGNAKLSVNHCTGGVTYKNIFAYGTGNGLNQYNCAHSLKLYNMTYYGTGRAIRIGSTCRNCDFRNNIAICNNNDTCIWFGYAATAPEVGWGSNIVHQLGAGKLAEEVAGECASATNCDPGTPTSFCNADTGGPWAAGTCSGNGQSCCWNTGQGPLGIKDCPGAETCNQSVNGCDPQHPGFSPGWGATAGTGVLQNNGLATFIADGNAGQWFGAESGDTDSWGVSPTFIGSPTTAAGLHLSPLDTIALRTGETIASVTTDYDGETRSVPYDRGADELSVAFLGGVSTGRVGTLTSSQVVDGRSAGIAAFTGSAGVDRGGVIVAIAITGTATVTVEVSTDNGLTWGVGATRTTSGVAYIKGGTGLVSTNVTGCSGCTVTATYALGPRFW